MEERDVEWSRAEFCSESVEKCTSTRPFRRLLIKMSIVEAAVTARVSRARGWRVEVLHADRHLPC